MDRNQKAIELRKQSIAGNIGRLFQMLIDIYGPEIKSLERIKKREGQEVQLYFKALETIITINLSKTRLKPYMRPSDIAVATVELVMEEDKIIPTIVDLIRTKNNLIGLLKVFFKYLITGKIKIKGSWGAAIKVVRLLNNGTHSMYKN